MPKKKLSDIVLHRVSPPDLNDNVSLEDLAKVIVRRLGLQRKKSRANHALLLIELMKFKKENTPVSIDKIASILSVSVSQTYEEIRKWRSLGLLEFVHVPMGFENIKGYTLSEPTVNRLLDRVESNLKAFMRESRRIAKDFDDNAMLEYARHEKGEKSDIEREIHEAQKNIVDSKDFTQTESVESEENDTVDDEDEENGEKYEEIDEKVSENKEKKPVPKEQEKA